MKNVLYIGWIGYHNLGDELMFDLFKQQFSRLGEDYKLDLVNNEKRYLDNAPLHVYDLIVLGGGSIISGPDQIMQPYIIETLYKSLQLNKKIMIWGSGIDWVPKSYIALDSLISWQVSPDIKQKAQTVFKESVWTGVRGPLTQQLLQHCGMNGSIEISGDPAFLLDQTSVNEKTEKMIGVNWGTSYQNIYGHDEITLENRLASALNQLIAKGYKIYFYLVWQADLEVTKRLCQKLTDQQAVILDEKVYHQDELMALMDRFAFTINFKLHANYLSLAAQTPFIALGYRFKIFDFAASIDLSDMVIATDDVQLSEKILSLEQQIITNKQNIADTMQQYQQMYQKKLIIPFEQGLYL
ncbi:polysaccharide pyruvyl transferase family protein [Gracilibacillus alcaliphilus]|uniref:polysaccharide pyruvyl transferase family protein n=1 Tax=Gracilibacillus alcaliphilus TaxID=1401441 RepID=UPI00195ABC53|nr:polysaccharide pyruvyl transferase family protein [Gracilibacillus alcaliphilus]MBM7676261.1 polysaccharide pyruvyl transferase WcaK-like protein [Gracilibacillus alcaliphilus]